MKTIFYESYGGPYDSCLSRGCTSSSSAIVSGANQPLIGSAMPCRSFELPSRILACHRTCACSLQACTSTCFLVWVLSGTDSQFASCGCGRDRLLAKRVVYDLPSLQCGHMHCFPTFVVYWKWWMHAFPFCLFPGSGGCSETEPAVQAHRGHHAMPAARDRSGRREEGNTHVEPHINE
jgi:hypothetical protein